MNWFWPKDTSSETTVLVRFGRFLHWIGVSLGVLIALIGIAGFHFALEGFIFAIWGIVAAIIGRGLRYVLANE